MHSDIVHFSMDGACTPVMVIDRDLVIQYINEAALTLFQQYELEFQFLWPAFKATEGFLLGNCVDQFYRNPMEHKKRLLDPLQLPYNSQVATADVCFDVNYSAIFDFSGDYIGCTLEWVSVSNGLNDTALNYLNSSQDDASDGGSASAEVTHWEMLDALNRAQAIAEIAVGGGVVAGNEEFLALTGYSLQEVQQHTLTSLFRSQGSGGASSNAKSESALDKVDSEHELRWTQVLAGNTESGAYELVRKNNDRSSVQLSLAPILDTHNKIASIVLCVQTISADLLLENDQEAISTKSGQAVVEYTMDGLLLDADATFLTLCGRELTDLKGQHHSDIVRYAQADDDFGERKTTLKETSDDLWLRLSRGEWCFDEFNHIDSDGVEFRVETFYSSMCDSSGEPYKIIGRLKCSKIDPAADDSADQNQTIEIVQAPITQDDTKRVSGEFKSLDSALDSLVSNHQVLIEDTKESETTIAAAAVKFVTEVMMHARGLQSSHQARMSHSRTAESTSQDFSGNVAKSLSAFNAVAQSVGSSVTAVKQGQEDLSAAVCSMSEIERCSNGIGKIVKVINEIAFQTNLFAMNAAVEATRAQEQGRNFSMVATEVRKLSRLSASTAKELEGLVNESKSALHKSNRVLSDSSVSMQSLCEALQEAQGLVAQVSEVQSASELSIEKTAVALHGLDEAAQLDNEHITTMLVSCEAAEALFQPAQRDQKQSSETALDSVGSESIVPESQRSEISRADS